MPVLDLPDHASLIDGEEAYKFIETQFTSDILQDGPINSKILII
jgi:hypothetical protein